MTADILMSLPAPIFEEVVAIKKAYIGRVSNGNLGNFTTFQLPQIVLDELQKTVLLGRKILAHKYSTEFLNLLFQISIRLFIKKC